MKKWLLLLMLAGPALADESVFFFRPSAAVSVTTSATALASDTNHSFVRICNQDASKILYWGWSSAVTTSSGSPLNPGVCLTFNQLLKAQVLYGIAASGTIDVRVVEALPSGR